MRSKNTTRAIAKIQRGRLTLLNIDSCRRIEFYDAEALIDLTTGKVIKNKYGGCGRKVSYKHVFKILRMSDEAFIRRKGDEREYR